MYFRGDGVSKNFEEALFWLELAMRQGVPGAEHNRDFVASFLDSTAIERTQQRIDSWHPEDQ
jgi:TPR repeat protein